MKIRISPPSERHDPRAGAAPFASKGAGFPPISGATIAQEIFEV
jgi:hypothetical protein